MQIAYWPIQSRFKSLTFCPAGVQFDLLHGWSPQSHTPLECIPPLYVYMYLQNDVMDITSPKSTYFRMVKLVQTVFCGINLEL